MSIKHSALGVNEQTTHGVVGSRGEETEDDTGVLKVVGGGIIGSVGALLYLANEIVHIGACSTLGLTAFQNGLVKLPYSLYHLVSQRR